MAQVMFAVFAERVSVDRFNNVVDIHQVLEEIAVPEPPADVVAKSRKNGRTPAVRFRFCLFIHWRRSDLKKAETRVRQRVRLYSPDNKSLAMADQEFTLRESTYARNLIAFEALPIRGEGTYRAVIYLGSGNRWVKAGATSFEVKYAKAPLPGDKVRLQ